MATDIIARGMAAEAEKTANKYKAGTNIIFTENADGTVAIEASGEVSSEDTVARNLINNHKENTNNPHGVTAEQIGLGNVNNTSDLEKPISNAMQEALDKKVDSSKIGSAAYKDISINGDASDEQVVMGNDSRLSDSRKADGGNADTLDGLHASELGIDIITDAAGIVTLDGLQGGVPFSGITLDGDIVGQEITLRAGGENLLKFSRHNETETISGVTFTRLPDGTITANGTATTVAQYLSDTVEMTDGESYTLTGCPAGGSSAGYSMTNQTTTNITDVGAGKTFTFDAATFGQARFKIRIAAGYTCDNLVFRPVLCSGTAVITKITPDKTPYIVTDDIRQQDGINTISVSAGNVTVTGVRKSRAVKRIWAKLDELTAAIIVSNGETTE